jgi:hypothetical protein
MKTELIAIVAALAFTACVPFPNRHYFAPEVSGTVIRNNAPAADAEVRLTSRFSEAAATTRTDAYGRFKLGPLSEMRFTRTVLGDPLYEYVLSINVAGDEEYRGLAEHGVGYAPEELPVICDLGKPIGQGKSLKYCSQNTPLKTGPAAGD